MPSDIIILQHYLTEQTMLVSKGDYLNGAKSRFRNFKLRGQGAFMAPTPLKYLNLQSWHNLEKKPRKQNKPQAQNKNTEKTCSHYM